MTEKNDHILKRFDQELHDLQHLIMEMGGLVENQIQQAVTALYEEDLSLAREVIARDHEVNALEIRADDEIARIIARMQPMGKDMRTVLSLSKTVTDLERIGDEAQRIARMTVHIYESGSGSPQARLLRDIRHMAVVASDMLRGSLDALARLDSERAMAITHGDQELDEQFRDALRRLITYMMEDPRTIGHAIDVMFMIKALERIGDHSKNIAEYVIYMVKGKDVRHLSTSAKQAAVGGE